MAKEKQKLGRKLTPIKAKEVEKLAGYGCTNVEIADFFGVNESTIRNRFSDIITKSRSNGKIRLRKRQYNKAMEGNVPLLIWLGKQMLGQKDKNETELSGNLEIVIKKH